MIPDLPQKKQVSEKELARVIDKHVSTVVRWTNRGVRGQVLKSYLVGGRRYVNRDDFLEFVTSLNVAHVATPLSDPACDRRRRINDELDQAGF